MEHLVPRKTVNRGTDNRGSTVPRICILAIIVNAHILVV